ncbi:MAG: M6 family metalloprotease domain-containing protein [Phycisphaerae bacterium]|jgi:M6 family metalloprotease-like protein
MSGCLKISAFYERIREDFRMRRVLFFAVVSYLFSVSVFCAPYLGKEFEFHQPDGSAIAVRVWGDEFYIRAETLDGYSLVRDPVSGFICYAEVNNDGSDFISTGTPYTGQSVEQLKDSGRWPLSRGNGIKKGLRLKHQAVIEKADKNRHLLGRDKHGRILPAPDSGVFSAAPDQANSPAPLLGQVVGLTLLIQFPDVSATISQADIDNYCNQVGYTGYGNNGSVRDYFYDVSNGNLTYTNYVTAYYTAQHNRSYYTDPSISYGIRAKELIKEALLWLDNPSGQNFNFGTISTDGGNYMLAINAFYAGAIQNNWAEGLWPHMSSMYGVFTSNEGVKSGVYQITNIGSSLVLGTFCHENGHMICDYPDLYDYGYESYGAGNYCLMAYGGSDYNPIPPNPYLRDIKGWESVTVFPPMSGVQYFLQSNSNTSYKYLNPGNSHEFFYIDSRTKTGRNSSLPDEGLVIWHIDENGSNDNQQMTPSQHYLVSVEQADGLFHLEHDNNAGGSGDLFHSGYKDVFKDTTIPNAKWWSGNNSNLVIRQISAVGSTMNFVYGDIVMAFTPDGGNYDSKQNVTITCATPGATIHYTTDGNAPSESDSIIASGSSVLVGHSLTLKARAWKTGIEPSEIKTADYQIISICPEADLSGDCVVNFKDFALLANWWLYDCNASNAWCGGADFDLSGDAGIEDVAVLADQWLVNSGPDGMVWVPINDSGIGGGHEGFIGEMSKYETTNAQYCQFLNAAKALNRITVYTDNVVYAISDTSHSQPYYDLAGAGYNQNGAVNGGAARINYSGGVFTVDSGFENHPVTYVSWYGATAFCNYYGYRLPTEWEWQAIADYDGSFIYGCGITINNSIANYYGSTHPDGTTVVGTFGAYGYGMCDMAGNVWEWTSTVDGSSRVIRGGCWLHISNFCTVSYRSNSVPYYSYNYVGFRVCH